MMRLILFMFLGVFSSFTLSQNWIKVDSVFAPGGVTVQDFTCPAFADIDNDGDFDLFLGNIENEVEFFRNIGTVTNPVFVNDTNVVKSIYSNGYMGTNADYPVIVDLNNDGLLDLCIGGYNGILFYLNRGTASLPDWVKIDTTFATVNSLIGSDAKPGFADIDSDGDLDLYVGIGESLMGGPTPGITMGFRNTGNAETPIFTQDNSLVTGIMDAGRNSYPTFADLNKDGDFDLLIGRDLSSFLYYQNSGNPSSPIWQTNSSLFSEVENIRYWKDPTFCDLDGDGDFDMIYGSDNGFLFFYQNIGTSTNPAFQYNPNYFKVLKVDGSSTVSFADFDKDGDFDLLSGVWSGGFVYFKNQGTNIKPNFVQTNTNFTNFDVGSWSSPVFVDLDNDGDLDIVSGEMSGTLFSYINNGTGFTYNSTIFASVDVGYSSSPAFADLDNDGKADLLIGAEESANAKFLKNAGNLVFVEDPSFVIGVSFKRNTKPAFADLDFDNDFDLIIGDAWGDFFCYENKGTPSLPVWSKNDTLLKGFEAKQNCSPGLADIDGDGKIDLVFGENDGNFTFLKRMSGITSVDNNQSIPTDFVVSQNYPNPFNSQTKINYQIPHNSNVKIILFNTLGEIVKIIFDNTQTAGKHEVYFSANDLPSGVYFYEISFNSIETNTNSKIVKKLILLK